MPGEGVEPSGNRSAVGHISRSVTPASRGSSWPWYLTLFAWLPPGDARDMERTRSANLFIPRVSCLPDGGPQDDHGHGPRDPPPGAADPRSPGDPRAPAAQLDPPARPHVPRLPRGEPLAPRALPRRGRGLRGRRDAPRPWSLRGRAQARPGRGPAPRRGTRPVLPHPRARPE